LVLPWRIEAHEMATDSSEFAMHKLRRYPLLFWTLNLLALLSWPTQAAVTRITLANTSFSTSSPPRTPVSFGHVFKPGDIPSGQSVVVSTTAGSAVSAQVDAKALHPDGSLRHAVISLLAPTINPGASLVLNLDKGSPAAATAPVALTSLLNTSFDAQIQVNLGGTLYSASAKSLLAKLDRTWLQGNVASEWHASGALTSSSGAVHPHLFAQFFVRAYAGLAPVRVDVVLENNWAYEANPSNLTYDVSVSLNGQNVFAQSAMTHYHHARWHKVFWSTPEPSLAVKYDVAYGLDTRALPHYDRTLVVPESSLANWDNKWKAAAAKGLMHEGLLQKNMPETGARPDIGPLPEWSATYWLSQDPRVKAAVLGTGDLGGAWSIHYRDKTSASFDTARSIVSLDVYPEITLLVEGGKHPLPKCGSCATPLAHDSAHQPSMAFLPYLISGDFYYLEELWFWANFNMIQANYAYREFAKGLVKWDQLRGAAWSLRTLGHAAYITPDALPQKAYFQTKLKNNLDWYNVTYSNNPNANKLGWVARLIDDYPISYRTSPWMDDFFTWSIGYLQGLGFAEATPLALFKAKFPVGRMTDPSWCWIQGAPYQMVVNNQTTGTALASFADAWAPTLQMLYPNNYQTILASACGSKEMATAFGLAEGEMRGYSTDPTGFVAQMGAALAIAVEQRIPNADLAWQRYNNRIKPISRESYAANPQWAIVPRDPTSMPEPPKQPEPPEPEPEQPEPEPTPDTGTPAGGDNGENSGTPPPPPSDGEDNYNQDEQGGSLSYPLLAVLLLSLLRRRAS
jgi:hypothetical protein